MSQSKNFLLSTATAVAVIILVVYIVYINILMQAGNCGLLGLYGFSEINVEKGQSDIPIEYLHPGYGYDGQFYYRLALDPFTDKRNDFGIPFDAQALRQQRILMPLVTWIIANGDPENIPLVMLGLNFAAIVGCCLVAGFLLTRLGVSPWLGILFGFYPGFAVSSGRFLTEPFALFFMLSSILMLTQRRHWLSALLLSFSVLSRETASLMVAAGFLVWLGNKKFSRKDNCFDIKMSFWLLPTLVFFSWQVWLYNNWSDIFISRASVLTIGAPFAGLLYSITANLMSFNLGNGFFLLMGCIVLIFWIYAAPTVYKGNVFLLTNCGMYMVLAIFVGTGIWSNSSSFLRVFTELNVLVLLAFLNARKTVTKLFIILWIGSWFLVASAEGYRMHGINQTKELQHSTSPITVIE